MVSLNDLLVHDGLYYVGHLIDLDGNDWVEEEIAQLILLEHNNGRNIGMIWNVDKFELI